MLEQHKQIGHKRASFPFECAHWTNGRELKLPADMRRATAESQAQPTPQNAASSNGNDFVTLAWELGDCMAFEPKKWRQVFAQSHAVLQNGSNVRAAQPSRAQRQRVWMKNHNKNGLRKTTKAMLYDAGATRRSSSRFSGSSSRQDDAPIAAESVRLPGVHRAPPSIAEYLSQPAMVEALLQEARRCDNALDKGPTSARTLQSETMSHAGHGNQALDIESESSADENTESTGESTTVQYSKSKSLKLPLLQVVSPRTRDGLARLPPPTQEDWRVIHELENLPEHKLSTQDLYRSLKRQQMRRLYTRHRDKREVNNEPLILRHKQRSPSSSKSVPLPEKTVEKMSVSSTRLVDIQREERIQMRLEDHGIPAEAGVDTISSPSKTLFVNDQTVSTSPLKAKAKSIDAYQHLTHQRDMLVREHDISISQTQSAQTQVAQTIEDIKHWIPLEVIYAYGMGKFASPAQQRATQILFQAGVRLKHKLVVQAMDIWKAAIYAMRRHETRLSSIRIQCWWRQIRAKRELKLRRRLRIKLQKRQDALRRVLIGKQQHAALVITRAVRTYGSKCVNHRRVQEYSAAVKIQTFWRQRQSSWILLKIHLHKQQRNHAAVRIQSQVRGRQARAKRKLLGKIARVETQRRINVENIHSRKVKMKQLGAAIAIQKFFRDWEIKRVMALRRRRARFEKDKIKICKVQAYIRGQQTRHQYKNYKDRVHTAVLTLQCAWRQHVSRAQLALRREEHDLHRQKIQEEIQERSLKRYGNLVSAYQVKKTWNQLKVLKNKVIQADTSELERKAASKLQALWRGKRLRQRLRYEEAHQREQARRTKNKKHKAAAIEIQRHVRGIQGRSLAWRLMINQSVERIQRVWRGFRTRQKLIRMRRALRSIKRMQYQWKRRRERASQQLRIRSAQQIQRLARKYLSKQWLYQMVNRQQFLSEEQTMGKVLVEATCRRIKDELLLQSFVYKTLVIQKDEPDDLEVEEDPTDVCRSLYTVDTAKKLWKRKGYDGVWQQVFRYASGGSLEIDSSHFARFLKSLPHSFINKSTFPMQSADLVFTKMKEPKARTISFSRFNKAMKMIWQERFGASSSNNRQSGDTKGAVEDNDDARYLHFMHRYVLHSTVQHGKFRSQLDVACMQRLQWSIAVLRRFGIRIARKKQHDHFLVLHQQNLLHRHEIKCARLIQKSYRRYRFRLQFRSMLSHLFVEYTDHNGRSVKFTHIETQKSITKRPIFLKGIRCQKRIPLPFPGEEFHAFCERHEDPLSPARVLAKVYCMECEDAMCIKCFERDHNKRETLQGHKRRDIQSCSHCGTETATRECLKCGNGAVPFCDVCFPHVHAKPDMNPSKSKSDTPPVDISQHRYQPLVVMCVECNARVAQWDCETCQDAYCKRCLSAFHAKGQRQHHRCHRLSYFSVLKQQTLQKRTADAQKERERRMKQREDERIKREQELQRQNDSATLIQAMARSYVARQTGKRYMKLVRQTVAAKAQRLKDEKTRSSITYKLRNVMGLAPSLKSDTTQEITARKERRRRIQEAVFLHRSLLRKNDPKAQKKWTKKKKQQIMIAADSWCVYDMNVKILKGEWRDNLGTIVSTQNLFVTGYVVVFIPLANRSIVINWEHIVPHDEDQYARRPYEPISRALLDSAHDFRVKLSAVVENTARMARLMYMQGVEFHDIVQYAWVVEFNKHEQKEEYWNVVLNKRVFEVPKAMQEIERMEAEPREALEDRVALAKTKIMDLLSPFQPRGKTNLAVRRNAIISLPKWVKHTEGADSTNRLLVFSDAMTHAVFWHERIACNSAFAPAKVLKFLAACHSAPYSTRDCWSVVQLWYWMDLYENDGFESAAQEFFKLAPDHQLFVVREFIASIEQGNFKEAKEKLQQLLKLKVETRDLLIFNAAQAQEK